MTVTSGPTSPRQFAFYDPDTSSWRTWPAIGLWGSEEFSGTWPRSGMTVGGAAFELATWEPPTDANGSSSLLLTPTAEDAGRKGSQEWADRWTKGEVIPETQQRLRTQVLRFLPTPTVNDSRGGRSLTSGRTFHNPNVNLGMTLTDWAKLHGESTSPPSPDGETSSELFPRPSTTSGD